mmetsp:Transcript_1461/g.3751  ORF Transcript_1461/g.3751 Transcript_1461/m.3751 type:complete len:179 (-) Transcript_1461:296-832(-)
MKPWSIGEHKLPTPLPCRIGGALFLGWGIMHIVVPCVTLGLMGAQGLSGPWGVYMNGHKAAPAPVPTDEATVYALNHLFALYVLYMAGFGVLACMVSYSLWLYEKPWFAYLCGLVPVGLATISYFVAMVTSGVMAVGVGSLSGPIIWLLAALITPFGLPKLGVRDKMSEIRTSMQQMS